MKSIDGLVIIMPSSTNLLNLDQIAIPIHMRLEKAALVAMTTTIIAYCKNPHPYHDKSFISILTLQKDQIGYIDHQDQQVLSRDTSSSHEKIGT